MRLFETFWIAPKGPPSFVSIFYTTMDVKKLQRVPPFTFFGTVRLFKNLILKNFSGNFFMSPKGPPSFFFIFFQPAGVSQSSKGPPFSILSLRYGGDFGRSRLVRFSPNACRLCQFSSGRVYFSVWNNGPEKTSGVINCVRFQSVFCFANRSLHNGLECFL